MVSIDIVVLNEEDPEDPKKSSGALASGAQSLAAAYLASVPRDFGFDIERIMPTIDVSRFMPKVDTSIISSIVDADLFRSQSAASIAAVSSMITAAELMPKMDFSGIWASSGAASVLSSLDAIGSLKGYGFAEPLIMPDLRGFDFLAAGMAARVKSIGDLLEPFLEDFRNTDWTEVLRRQSIPANWSPAIDDRLELLIEMESGEGIPAAWVPHAGLLTALLDAAPGDERSALLIERREEILEDCADWVDDLEDEFLAPVLPVAREVLDACRSGHWRVAAISAVTVVHNIVEALHWVSDRQRVAKHHRLTMNTPHSRLLEQATRAPLVPFYDEWNPQSGKPRPVHVTRHVVSHHLDADQVTERNCIVAVMLMSSLIVTVYQLELGRGEHAA